ncbi:hypothetical protein M128_3318 [Bacteroides fragilis str. S6L8]|uniref:Uncharacterized protein n=1 Tax=Bacteroides fragilis str. S36L11 TaxID=1339327 RepID=A0A016AGQ0_BACFG|nr:hypothetical protein M074_3158 [Bacteroides fragilis str. DS-166]EXZ04527.1 hypothetical protein M072_3008 [Bacteroides fragilis str. DS-208]EXZ18670.1 hypothetical protein M067_3126 [Bacteroides fragilis str. J-143-4]EXZ27596.1 hypothetical protein M136_3161 [Bacteroides fragilis str. S36L11]EXZ48030.1 hypothetical protein M109_3073 [Bacteroides fragilis str. 3397 N2]EXZ52775.1 hypothetical protein M108_3157 [Bacteroides fragilis str. 3397 T14]EXZ57111.1 hypothetical protein M116_3247 [Ba
MISGIGNGCGNLFPVPFFAYNCSPFLYFNGQIDMDSSFSTL